MKKAVFAGTFDPFTVGHEDTVKKSLALFDEVIVAVAENKKKQTLFTARERADMISAVFEKEKRVSVVIWEGVIAELLNKEGTPFYVRGVRNITDFVYETDDFYASRDLAPGMIELYLPAEQKHTHISSSLVKNCIAFGTPFGQYVPAAVREYIERRQTRV